MNIEFEAEVEGRTWTVWYNVVRGRIWANPNPRESRIKSAQHFLKVLHTRRMYPDKMGINTFWALMVDLTAVLMMLWAISGVLMWWQIKVARVTGVALIAASLFWALALGYLMYAAIS